MLTPLEIWKEKQIELERLQSEVRAMERDLLDEWKNDICDFTLTNWEADALYYLLTWYLRNNWSIVWMKIYNTLKLILKNKPSIQ